MKNWNFQTKISYKKNRKNKEKEKKKQRDPMYVGALLLVGIKPSASLCGDTTNTCCWCPNKLVHLLGLPSCLHPRRTETISAGVFTQSLIFKGNEILFAGTLCLEKSCRLQQAKAHTDTHTSPHIYINKYVYTWSNAIKIFCWYCKQIRLSIFA